MQSFRHFRLSAASLAAVLGLCAAPAGAATKSHEKDKESRKPAKRVAVTHLTKHSPTVTHSTKHSPKKSYAKAVSKKPSATAYAKTPPKKIDIAKLEPVESLYRKHEAEPPASRSLSFFGSLASSHHYDSRMIRAAEIATARAYGHSHGSCWRYVKNALLDAGVVESRPKTGYAKEAASELTNDFGFRRIACNDPLKAPIGSVIVYGGSGAGHVELRTKDGFVSDFTTPNPSKRPLIGVYVKP